MSNCMTLFYMFVIALLPKLVQLIFLGIKNPIDRLSMSWPEIYIRACDRLSILIESLSIIRNDVDIVWLNANGVGQGWLKLFSSREINAIFYFADLSVCIESSMIWSMNSSLK